jgi:glycosyltransferase involved in cell wall biosynthesis
MKTPKTIRILHISTPLSWRGGEQQLGYLLDNLSFEEQVEQHLLCPKNSVLSSQVKDNIPTYTFKKRSGLGLFPAMQLKKICREKKIDLIHVHDSQAHTLAYISGLLGNKCPIVVSRRVDFHVATSFFSKKKYNSKNVRALVAVSEAIADILKKDLRNRRKDIHVVYSGVDIDVSDEKTSSIRQDLGLSKGDVLIGNVAALADHKDYPTFLKTAQAVGKEFPNTHFAIVGSGPLEEELILLASEMGVPNLHFLGYRKDAKAILAQFDILLFPSKTEGLGTTILDAFVRQTPVVATAAGGIPELIIHNRTGLLNRIGDVGQLAHSIRKLLTDDELREHIVYHALEFVKDFSHQNTAKNTLSIYREMLL